MPRFHLPCLGFPDAAAQTTFVHLIADKGWAVHAEELHNLGAPPEPWPSEPDRSYLSRQATYGGIFDLRPITAHADLLALSLVEVRDRQIGFRAMLDYEIGQRKSRTLTVHLRNWKGQDVRLEAPGTVIRSEPPRDPLIRTWRLEVPPALTGRVQCQLSGTLASDGNALVIMPEVSVEEAASSERWLAIIGQGLRPEEQRGLVTVADAARVLKRWPAAADHLQRFGGSVWKIDAPDWKLHLRSDLPLVEARPAQLFLEDQAAAIPDGSRWLHEATYWLYQESGTHLGILLPQGATLLRASLDGAAILPLKAGSERFWLPLTGGSGLRTLRLSWVFDADRERLDLPRLEKPRLENVVNPPVQEGNPTFYTVHIPPGYSLADYGGNSGNLLERYLHMAAAELRATKLLAEHAAGEEAHGQQLLIAQLRFYRHCRDALYELAFPERLGKGALNVDSLAARLRTLQSDNKQLSRTHHFERIRAQAEADATSGHRAEIPFDEGGFDDAQGTGSDDVRTQQGTPTYWQVSADSGEPRVRLQAIQTGQTRQAFGYSGFLLVLFLVAWIMPFYPRAVTWLWAFWPEQIMVLGGLAWLVCGSYLTLGVLVFLGVVARLIYLGRWAMARFRRPVPAAGGSGASSAS